MFIIIKYVIYLLFSIKFTTNNIMMKYRKTRVVIFVYIEMSLQYFYVKKSF